MASPLSSIGKAPVWQVLLGSVLAGGLLTAGWYFSYYEDAANALEQAQVQNAAAKAELEKMQEKLENYEQEMRDLAAAEEEIAQLIREIPSTEATVDHLMKPFQRQARLVGFEIRSWAPGAEQRFDYYAKTPVEIHAAGTWHQTAEFFRKVSEMEQVVNIEEVRMTVDTSSKDPASSSPRLRVDFSAASFRFLPEAAAPVNTSRRGAGAEPGAAPAAGGAAPAGGAPPAKPAPQTKEG